MTFYPNLLAKKNKVTVKGISTSCNNGTIEVSNLNSFNNIVHVNTNRFC